jgi:serine/threonine protein kinase
MNIVKFHGYWQDRSKVDDRPRVIVLFFLPRADLVNCLFFFTLSMQVVFITEYMSSGSLKAFLRKTKKTKQNLSKNSWRRWCIQLLSALKYAKNNNTDIPACRVLLPLFL